MSKLSVWQKDKKELRERRAGYWAYIQCLVDVVQRESYLEEYENLEAFLQTEAEISRPRFYQLQEACQTRQRLSTVVDSPPEKERHLREITKVPEDKQVEVFATTLEKCESEGREPTAKDFRLTAKEIVDSDPVKPAAPKPKPPTNGQAVPTAAQLAKQLTSNHIGPVIRGIDEIARINGGQGPIWKACSGSLGHVVDYLEEMGGGEK